MNVTIAHDLSVVTLRGEGGKIEARIALPQQLTAPVEQGQPVGRMVALLDGVEVAQIEVIAAHAVPRAPWLRQVSRNTREFVRALFLFTPD